MKIEVLSIALTCALLGACGGDSSGADGGADAGQPPVLAIVAPGDSVGLAPGDAIELRVRYTTFDDVALPGAPVTFSLIAGDGGSGGSALSASTVATDGDGEAAVSFLAGSDRVDLQVTADAPGARATFYINVSPGGFAELVVTPRYDGGRGVEELERVELRLYRAATASCDDIDVDLPPESPMAPRTLPSWDASAVWPSVAANESYALLIWGVHAVSGGTVSAVCVDLPATAVPPGDAHLEVAVPDRPLALLIQNLTTALDLGPLDAELDQLGAHRPWRILACPVGRGQLVLDWLVDALTGDGALDGVTTTPTGLGATLSGQRGVLGAGGCRPATRGAGPSLDATLDNAIDAGPFPGGAALTLMLTRRAAMLDGLVVASAIEPMGPTLFAHTLVAAETTAVGAPTVILADTARPVLTAVAVTSPPLPGDFTVGGHGFTLHTGALLRDSHDALALAPVGLGGDSAALGAALVGSAVEGASDGCDAVSELACEAVGSATTCAVSACGAAAFALDGALAAWWRLADGTGVDLSWSGTAPLADADGDLIGDPLADGAWAASLTLLDGDAVEVSGTFGTPVE